MKCRCIRLSVIGVTEKPVHVGIVQVYPPLCMSELLSSSGGGANNEVDDKKTFVSLLPRAALLSVQVGRASGRVFTWLSHAT